MYSHFTNVDDLGQKHTKKQAAIYAQACEIFERFGYKDLITHISSTGGIVLHEPECNHKLARLGIGLYGMWPSEEMKRIYEEKGLVLRPAMRWISKVAQVKTVPANYAISYGLTYITKEPTKIAIIPQGYSDGFDRKLSNSGEVLIRGRRCKVLGRVAMNMFVVDVSGLDVVKCEDEVVLLGFQSFGSAQDEVTAEEIADKDGTIDYEIVTRLSPLLPRVLV